MLGFKVKLNLCGTPIQVMENQMEKKIENKMEAVVIKGLYWGYYY